MKILVTIALSLTLAWVMPPASAQSDATGEPALVRGADSGVLPPHSAAEGTADSGLVDLSLLGIVALGVAGLFWIRRHTSEL